MPVARFFRSASDQCDGADAQALQKPLKCKEQYGDKLTIRVSLDHYAAMRHDEERGAGGYSKTLGGLLWLTTNGFKVAVAGRTRWEENEAALRAGYAELFAEHRIPLDAADPRELVLFPEMDERVDVPEITTACWGILGKDELERESEPILFSNSGFWIKLSDPSLPGPGFSSR